MKPGHLRTRAAIVLCTVLAAACASYERPLNAALFPAPAAAAAKDPASVSFEVADRELRYHSPRLSGSLVEVEMPIGRIVEAAGARALSAEFEHVVDAAPGGEGRALQVRVRDITPAVRSKFVYFIPLGPFPLERVDVWTRLAFDVEVLGPDGSARWVQRYDSGEELLVPRRSGLAILETAQDAVQRAMHEQAARLMGQAARDLRTWLEPERRRERLM